MSLVKTTLSSACAVVDGSIVVASASGFAAGSYIRIDQETMVVAKNYVSGTTIPVIRGQEGSTVIAHPSGASVVCGVGSDWSTPADQTVVQYPTAGRARLRHSYSASGAIALPTPGADEVAELNGTSTLTMTLAVPNKDMDGSMLTIIANGKGAHTVTVADDIGDGGGSNYNVLTFNASGRAAVQLMAINSLWVLVGPVAGTLTNVVATLA